MKLLDSDYRKLFSNISKLDVDSALDYFLLTELEQIGFNKTAATYSVYVHHCRANNGCFTDKDFIKAFFTAC